MNYKKYKRYSTVSTHTIEGQNVKHHKQAKKLLHQSKKAKLTLLSNQHTNQSSEI
jgi:hypothetical protein